MHLSTTNVKVGITLGTLVGISEGFFDGFNVGERLGSVVTVMVGKILNILLGLPVGILDDSIDGLNVGEVLGSVVGIMVGKALGIAVGKVFGVLVGLLLGITDGMFVELIDGGLVGNNDILNDGIFDTIEGRSLGILFGRLHDPHDFGQFSRNIFHVQYLLISFTSLQYFFFPPFRYIGSFELAHSITWGEGDVEISHNPHDFGQFS